jgi:hypothetical protein
MKHFAPIWIVLSGMLLAAATIMTAALLIAPRAPLTSQERQALLQDAMDIAIWHAIIMPAVGLK